jgi:integrase
LLLAQGVSPRVVQEVLEHSTITLTLGTYSHVLPALSLPTLSNVPHIGPTS